jgi:uncharacterized protein YbjT (DUF2867 family)
MKILVYGGTGSQGSAIVRAARANGHEVTIFTRQPDKVVSEPGVRAVAGDLDDPASVRAASVGIDAVAMTLSFFAPDPVAHAHAVIDAAKAAGVPWLVYNTSGPVIAERIGNPGYDLRRDIIDALEISGLPHMVLQPTVYMENLLGPWTREGIIAEGALAYPVSDATRLGWLASDDLGALMVAALERPNLAGRRLPISGPENLTGPELAAIFSEVLGRPIRYQAITPEAFGELLDRMIAPGAGEGAAAGYRFQRDNGGLLTMWTDMTPALDMLPVRLTPLREWVARFAFLFQPQAEAQG